jgi:hypothetical protein
MTRGGSAVGGFETLQTLRSPSAVCVASMSDFCFDDEACHVRFTIGEGARDVVSVWRIVKAGCNAANNMEPLLYLRVCQQASNTVGTIKLTRWHRSYSPTTERSR